MDFIVGDLADEIHEETEPTIRLRNITTTWYHLPQRKRNTLWKEEMTVVIQEKKEKVFSIRFIDSQIFFFIHVTLNITVKSGLIWPISSWEN